MKICFTFILIFHFTVMSAEISFFMENYETLCFNDVLAKNTLVVIKTRSKSNQYKFTLLYSEDT